MSLSLSFSLSLSPILTQSVRCSVYASF